MILSMFLMQLPTFIVCGVACLVILSRWKEGSQGSFWALVGFGSVLGLCILMPVAQALVQSWAFQGEQRAGRMWVFSAFSLVWSLLHAATYVFLLIAVFAGRGTSNRPQTPPFSSQ